MVNSITRSLNIVAIMTKKRSKTIFFLSIKLYIRLTHARSHFQNKYSKRLVFTVFTLKMDSCMCKPNI